MAQKKTVLITGANSGIGLATAHSLAKSGYNVVTICRRKAEGEKLAADLKKLNSEIIVKNFCADLGDLAGLKAVAVEILAEFPVIDRLINNAGYYPSEITYNGEIETSFLASHLGHMLLTLNLMPALEKSKEGRVINVSSALHTSGKVERYFKKVEGLDGMKAYGDAKLANILFAMGLAKHSNDTITAFSLHPGVVRTNFGADISGFFKMMLSLFKPFMITPEKGAATSIYLATTEIGHIKPYNGRYFEKARVSKTKNADVSPENVEFLWNKSMAYLKPYL